MDQKYKSDLGADIEVIADSDTSVDKIEDDPIAVPFTPVPLNEIYRLNSGATVGMLMKNSVFIVQYVHCVEL